MKLVAFMQAALSLIDTPAKWTKGSYGKDKDGCPLEPSKPGVCYCSMGAIYRAAVTNDIPHHLQQPLIHAAQAQLHTVVHATGWAGVMTFNDAVQHTDVMRAWEQAIRNAEVYGHEAS